MKLHKILHFLKSHIVAVICDFKEKKGGKMRLFDITVYKKIKYCRYLWGDYIMGKYITASTTKEAKKKIKKNIRKRIRRKAKQRHNI